MEGKDVHPVRLRTDEFQQPSPHGLHPGIGKCQTQDVVGLGIRFRQDAPDAGSQDMGFPVPGPAITRTGPSI